MATLQEELKNKLQATVNKDFSESEKATIKEIRTEFGEVVASVGDKELLNTWKLWSISSDSEAKEDFLSWLFINENKQEEQEVQPTEEPEISVEGANETVVEEFSENKILEESDVLDFDDLNPRQRFSFIIDEMRRRQEDAMREEIISTLMQVYKQDFASESDIMRKIAESYKLRDYLIELFNLIGVKLQVTSVPSIANEMRDVGVRVSNAVIKFHTKISQQYTMADFENGLRLSFKILNDHKDREAQLAKTVASNVSYTETIVKLNKELSLVKNNCGELQSQLNKANNEKRPAILHENGRTIIMVRWKVSIKDKHSVEYFLTVPEGTKPNAKGVFATRDLRRTKFIGEALHFDSEDEALFQLQRMLKHVSKLHVDAKISVKSIKSAEVITMYAAARPFSP
jgi:hypothetical protein